MSKLKIEHGASKINLVLLKTNIEDGISQDIDLMATEMVTVRPAGV